MASIKPFKAIRPAPDKVSFVASRSYEEYDKKELKAVLAYNPYSFLHIINPGFKYHRNSSGEERFKLVRNRYLEFLEESTLIRDLEPCFYLYQISKNDFSSLGLFCITSIEDYRKNIIKKHEDTIEKRVSLFKDYLNTVGFNAEPVLMTYEDKTAIRQVLNREIKHTPAYDFTTTDGFKHTMWKVSSIESIQKLEMAFDEIQELYIADGHHRSASSELLLKELEHQKSGNSNSKQYFLSYLIPESEIKISGFNRMLSDLNGLTKQEFLVRLDEFFLIEHKKYMGVLPKSKHQFTMYLEDEFYILQLRKNIIQFEDALSRLDTYILYKTILKPILGIEDLTRDKRISYSQGKADLLELKESIDNGPYKVGFSTAPISIEEIKAIADEGLVMPPKSTYIEPKLRSGLTIYEI
ncbi:DUF1015 domain-containing protein [Croceivirga thetidis]|uniref:DUF1015 domain-containing protein n=1 Tax=Croceivirga thetidis TaxID=2721623 RepID=A0ABX1GU20_9FLAO|nr:DUF1015 domain-containing protein [Croceivirga thetidis]NKI32546.1 DUF1015 domain-containing protein [Croceivirga thetidis]